MRRSSRRDFLTTSAAALSTVPLEAMTRGRRQNVLDPVRRHGGATLQERARDERFLNGYAAVNGRMHLTEQQTPAAAPTSAPDPAP